MEIRTRLAVAVLAGERATVRDDEASRGGRERAVVLGAGDVIRPWQTDGLELLEARVRWSVLADARLAVLDRKTAIKLATTGFRVKELIGGLDWWKRDGHATEGRSAQRHADHAGCGCAG